MSCQVCGAPPLPDGGRCVFCHSPLTSAADPGRLPDYLAEHLRGARVRRGTFGRGRVRDLTVTAGGRTFRAQVQRERLTLEPAADPARWADDVLSALSRDAVGDADVRRDVTRAGWALR
ncbi:MAG: hypothetical protein M3024_07365 [Candidatus Dormibacteraeota bacterium]|nr:hypothetical protein [Candidatus Dormibacteraeota bacterium]